jgi:hypothetical protein
MEASTQRVWSGPLRSVRECASQAALVRLSWSFSYAIGDIIPRALCRRVRL